MHTIAQVIGTGDLPDYGCLFAIHNDILYFTPGRIRTLDGASIRYHIDVYTFNGSHIERISTLLNIPYTPETVGFLTWRDSLIYYAINDGDTTPQIKVLVGDDFIDFASPTVAEQNGYQPWIGNLNGQLVMTAYHATNGEGLHYAGRGSLADGYVITSRLDFDSPGRQKRLEQLSVTMNDAAASFNVIIKYRTDDNTSWTTAVTTANSRIIRATALGVNFYTLQIRVDLDDDSGGNKDYRITAINAIVTEPGK
jgi:hypothetical protein